MVTNGAINPDEIFNNLIVFIPVGLYLSMLKPEWSFVQKVLPILGLSLFYEVVQYLFAIGASDITDLIANTAGGVVGLLLFSLFQKCLKEKTGKILNLLAVIATILLLGFFLLILVANGF